ncbi:unnamed protein product [Schistocephalus solidus]|uniref:Endo/exonuclease/phosphatase domain-containing protein n=1 Tax=Schistocephalus solidus TaxID=70667 RepID=A0A183SNT6_SCHSO|nr:unnamed protein product [Schistocephalus solidus]
MLGKSSMKDCPPSCAAVDELIDFGDLISVQIRVKLPGWVLPSGHTPGDNFATIISAYAPLMMSYDVTKDKFYENLPALLMTLPKVDKLIVLGDFNNRVRRTTLPGRECWVLTVAVAVMIQASFFCERVQNTLLLTNTFTRLPMRKNATWMHPLLRRWQLLDYVLVRRRDRLDLLVTKAIRDADGWTDHNLIMSHMRLLLKP